MKIRPNPVSGLIKDLLDQRACVPESHSTVIDALKLIVPLVVGSILPLMGPLSEWINAVPALARWVRVLFPFALILLCLRIIAAKHQKESPAGFRESAGYEYSYSKPVRVSAKLFLVPLIALMIFTANDSVPNWVLRRDKVVGFACDMTGAPLSSGSIEVLDSFGRVVSDDQYRIDDRGFFAMKLQSSGMRPKSLRIYSPGCAARNIDVSEYGVIGTNCPRQPSDSSLPPSAIWSVECKH